MKILKKGRTDVHFFEDIKYGCECSTCGTVFIADSCECSGGYWERDGLYCDEKVKCPICGKEQIMTFAESLFTNIDEENFLKKRGLSKRIEW